MTRGVRISSIRIEAFRGISNTIDFDFSSPITLIYAPNGTGKTTLCEAAEWLLTGQVERLHTSRNFDPTILRSKFVADNSQPFVQGQLYFDSKNHTLQRTLQNSQQIAQLSTEASRAETIERNELLAKLAPAAAAEDAHATSAINLRQRWLRGTRFLSAEALAALVDSDDDTLERRAQVFADLLGIRHLLDAEKICGKFITEASAKIKLLDQAISSQEDEINQLESSIAIAEQNDHATRLTSALSEIENGERLLQLSIDIEPTDPLQIRPRLERLTVECEKRSYELERRSEAVEMVSARWAERSYLEEKVSKLSEQEEKLEKQLKEIKDQGSAKSTDVVNLEEKQAELSELNRTLSTAKDKLTNLIIDLIRTLNSATELSLPPDIAISNLKSFVPETSWTKEAQLEHQLSLRSAVSSLGSADHELRRYELLQIQLIALRQGLVPEEEIADLRSYANKMAVAAAKVRSELAAISDPMERLQAAGREFLTHTHDTAVSSCPLCSYDWSSSDAMRSALTNTLKAVPHLIKFAQAASTEADKIAKNATNTLNDALSLSQQAAQLEKDAYQLHSSIETRKKYLESLGIDTEDTAANLESALKKIEIAIILSDLIKERDHLGYEIIQQEKPILPEDIAISNIYQHFNNTLVAREQEIQLQLATTRSNLERSAIERDTLRTEYRATSGIIKNYRDELSEVRPKLEKLRYVWSEAFSDRSWNPEALSDIKTELDNQKHILASTAANIAAAGGALNSEMRQRRLQEVSNSIEPVFQTRQHLQNRVDAAKRAKAVFHQTYTEVSKRQIDELTRVVNPLFARMHANRVYDRINLGEADNFLHWLADAGTAKLDPGMDFSQGQRQDLALSLFLARARTLGGTFFLDEPVTHLDDLNRVGLLDIFRATVMESSNSVNLVITTSSKALARHFIEKFQQLM